MYLCQELFTYMYVCKTENFKVVYIINILKLKILSG